MRQGEVSALTWDDVQWEQGIIAVTRGREKAMQGFQTGTPKTTRSIRPLDLSPRVLAALREHRTRQLEERL